MTAGVKIGSDRLLETDEAPGPGGKTQLLDAKAGSAANDESSGEATFIGRAPTDDAKTPIRDTPTPLARYPSPRVPSP